MAVQKETTHWDDVRLFLELTRHGSARAAAEALGVSHSTIVRRIENLETGLGARLFDRDYSGYRPTAAGETLLASALKAEEALLEADRRLHGQDEQLTGDIRITMPDIVATRFLMPYLVEFQARYPDIELIVIDSYDVFDLARREADLAIRAMPVGKAPPDDLIGRKLGTGATCVYATPEYLEQHPPDAPDSSAQWVGWGEMDPSPDWVAETPFPNLRVRGSLNTMGLQASAVQNGYGLGVLPTILGDSLDGVIRVPGCEPTPSRDLWMLTHPDLRDAARHRVFREFIVEVFDRERSRLGGKLQ